jgi:hypothetical protein
MDFSMQFSPIEKNIVFTPGVPCKNIRPLQDVEYDILKELDKVCRKNGFTYFLAFGTMLGAVRHQGFIPWDDDIDVIMPLEDYNKLELLRDECFHEPYFLQSYESEPACRLCYKKLRRSDTTLIAGSLADKKVNHGINIDIYPYIHLADGTIKRTIQYLNAMVYMLLTVSQPPKNHRGLYAKGARILLSVIPDKMKDSMRKYTFKKMTKYEGTKTEYVFFVIGQLKVMKECYKREWFVGSEHLKFVDREFPVPKGYKDFLKTRYGKDYMNLPPKEEQGVKLNDIVVWNAHVPYLEYENKSGVVK